MRKPAPPLRTLTASLLLGTLLRTAPAISIEDSPLKLVWTAPRHCPQHHDLTPQIRKLVGTKLEPERIAPLSARGVIETHGDEFHLTLLIQDGTTTGTRSITSTNCRSLGDAAAVVLSLLIRQRYELGRALSGAELSGGQDSAPPSGMEPSREASTDAPPPSPAITATPKPQIAPPPTASRATPREAVARDAKTNKKGWRFLLAAPVMHIEYGTLPKISSGAGVALGVGDPRWQFFASGVLFEPQTLQVTGRRDFEARFLNRAVAGSACRTWTSRWIHLAPCAQLGMNFLGASTSTNDGITSQSRTGTWLSLGGGVKVSLRLNQLLGVFVRATGRINVTRPEFLFVEEQAWENPNSRRIHRISAGLVDLSFGCEWLF